MVTGILHDVHLPLAISSLTEFLNTFRAALWIHPVQITIYSELCTCLSSGAETEKLNKVTYKQR